MFKIYMVVFCGRQTNKQTYQETYKQTNKHLFNLFDTVYRMAILESVFSPARLMLNLRFY